MNRLLCYCGFSFGIIMFVITTALWFKLHIYKAFVDVLGYGSNRKWIKRSSPGERYLAANRTAELFENTVTAQLKKKTGEETTLLDGVLANPNESSKVRVLEEIVFVHTDEDISD